MPDTVAVAEAEAVAEAVAEGLWEAVLLGVALGVGLGVPSPVALPVPLPLREGVPVRLGVGLGVALGGAQAVRGPGLMALTLENWLSITSRRPARSTSRAVGLLNRALCAGTPSPNSAGTLAV